MNSRIRTLISVASAASRDYMAPWTEGGPGKMKTGRAKFRFAREKFMKLGSKIRTLFLFGCVLTGVRLASGQGTAASLSGMVFDPQGSAVPAVSIRSSRTWRPMPSEPPPAIAREDIASLTLRLATTSCGPKRRVSRSSSRVLSPLRSEGPPPSISR